MKNQANKSFKSNIQSTSHRDPPGKIATSTEKQPAINPLKNEEVCHSARNWKIEASSSTVGLESLRNRGLISPIISPKSKYPNLPYPFTNRHNQSLQRLTEKSNTSLYTSENHQGTKPDMTSHLVNTSHEILKYKSFHPANMQTSREVKNSPPKNAFLEVFRKMPSMHQDGSYSYALSSERNFPLEVSSARDVNPQKNWDHPQQPRKTMTNYTPQGKQKQAESLNIIGSAINPNPGSPTRNLTDNNPKSKIKEQCPLSHFISGHLTQRNAAANDALDDERSRDEGSSTIPIHKKGSFGKQSASPHMNSNILENSETSRRGESQITTKDTSYIKDNSARVDEKQVPSRLVKKADGSFNVMNVRNFQINKQRPDSSFDRNHLHSVKSADFYQSTPLDEEQRPFPKVLKSGHMDILDTDERFKKDNDRHVTEKSKKNFYQFHNKLFTENSKRIAGSQNDLGSSFNSHLIKDNRNFEGKLQHLESLRSHPLEINLNSSELPSLDALISPQGRTSETNLSLQTNKARKVVTNIRIENSGREVLSSRRHPNTTKNQGGEFKLSFDDQNSLRFGKRIVSNGSQMGEYDIQKTNKSMTVSLHDRSQKLLLKNDKSCKTLTNDEIEEKLVYQKPEHSKNLSFGAANDEEENEVGQAEETKISNQAVSEKKESPEINNKLKDLYERIKVDLQNSRREKCEWLAEKKQLLEKIGLLEKRVIELEKSN